MDSKVDQNRLDAESTWVEQSGNAETNDEGDDRRVIFDFSCLLAFGQRTAVPMLEGMVKARNL
jgi:hypothetical protein